MSGAFEHVLEALDGLQVWPAGKARVERQLGDGPTNETWLVTCEEERYVLRLVRPFAATVGLSLASELQIVRAAQRRDLAPEVVASCVERGVVLSRYVPGRAWTAPDLRDHQQLGRLAQTLKSLHALACEGRPRDLRATLQDYARRSGDAQSVVWRDTALAIMDSISARGPVVCHNDLTAANIIERGDLCLIDWEYAAPGDPLFDLAVVVAHHELDDAATRHFLFAYLGRRDDQAAADLRRWCVVYRSLLVLWQTLLCDVSHARQGESGV